MTVDELIRLAEEWRNAQLSRTIYQHGSEKNAEALATIERVTLQLRSMGLDITTDGWANVVIEMPFKL